MDKLIRILGNLAGAAGILLCVIAGVARLAQSWYVAGFQTTVLFIVGIGLMVFGCLAKLHLLESR